jgi:Fur family ferric uptake transcriptional regulator
MPQARGTRVRYTRQAAAIVAVMSGMRTFRGARDIYGALLDSGQHVGLATVYRHLHVLAERGEVDTIQTATGETRYLLRASAVMCHLTCRTCGCVVEVDGSKVLDWARQVAADAGFTLTDYLVGLSGECPAHGGGGCAGCYECAGDAECGPGQKGSSSVPSPSAVASTSSAPSAPDSDVRY